MPVLSPLLRRKLFLVLMAEDRNQDGPDSPRLRTLRWEFLASAIEAGWTVLQAGSAIGVTRDKALSIIGNPPSGKDRESVSANDQA